MTRTALISDTLGFISLLSFRKVWNYLGLRMSYFVSILFSRSWHSGWPASISIEPTTSCNLRCPECPVGMGQFTRPQGMMSADQFKHIIDQLHPELTFLMLYFQGEPLMNQDIYEMLTYARGKKIYTATSTNAHYLDEQNARRMVESGLDRLIISMDGTDQGTYEKYRRRGDYETVKKGVENVVKWKKKLRSSKPYVILQFLVFKHNEHQIGDIKKIAKELGVDKLQLKSAQVYNFGNDEALIPENRKHSRYIRGADGRWKLKKPIKNRCFRMWSGAVITWDGRVVPCCFDKDAEQQFGKLGEIAFKEIWRSRSYVDFRRIILSNRQEIDICRNCTE